MKTNYLIPVISFVCGIVITAVIFNFSSKKDIKEVITTEVAETKTPDPMLTKVVYGTHKTEGYYFPTHDNLLVMDRSNAEVAEAFIVQIAPNKHSHRHIHNDTEQIFYILSGQGRFDIERGGKKESLRLKPADFVHAPRNCYHQTFCEGTDSLKYLAIDCFPSGHNPDEPTWDSHARAICEQNGWDYDQSRIKK